MKKEHKELSDISRIGLSNPLPNPEAIESRIQATVRLDPERHPKASHDQIAQRAYANWKQHGCPTDAEEETWLNAEQQLRKERHLH